MAITTRDPVNIQKMIEKFVGTEYDKLAAIYDNLPALLSLQASVEELADRYLGVLDTVPTERPNGDLLQDGDYFMHTTDKVVYYYVSGSWVSAANTETHIQKHVVAAGDIVGSDTVITFPDLISTVSGGNMVFVSTAYQYSTDVDPAEGAYTVTADNQITFTGSHLQIGEEVVVVSGTSVNTVAPLIQVTERYYVAETTDQYVVPMPGGISSTESPLDIQVFLNGRFLTSNLDYTKNMNNSITLAAPASPGDVITFLQGSVVTNVPSPTSDALTLPLLSSFYDNQELVDGSTDRVILVKGGYTIGDGSGGMFVFDGTFEKTKANGVTAIDPSQDLASQGNSAGNGCWMRQYEGLIKPEWFNSTMQGIGALRFCVGLPDDRVIVDGFYENSSQGSGMFVWDDNVDSADHNGVTVVSPLVIASPGGAAWFTAPASGTPGCWIRMDNNKLTSDHFGADSSGGDFADNSFIAMENQNYPVEVVSGVYKLANDYTSAVMYSFGSTSVTGAGSATIKDLMA